MVDISKLWYKMSAEEVQDFFLTDSEAGLKTEEVSKRSKKFGFNDAKIFSKRMAGFFEYNTIRNSKIIKIKSNKLILGDIILLKKGDIVPAKLRIIKVKNLSVNEEKQTGNPAPTYKNTHVRRFLAPKQDQVNMLFAGSIILDGATMAIVVDYSVPKIFNKSSVHTPKTLANNNMTLNNRMQLKKLKTINTVIFDDLKQDYEVEKTSQQIFIKKGITCVYFLDKNILKKCLRSMQNVKLINSPQEIKHIGNEIIFVKAINMQDKAIATRKLMDAGRKVMYVYRGDEYMPAASIADLSLVINKKSSQESIFRADIVADKVVPNNLSSILYNKI